MGLIHTIRELDLSLEWISRVWTSLDTNGYILITDNDISPGAELRLHMIESYFDRNGLEEDLPEVHSNRDRARDVIRYKWHQDYILLSEHDSVEMTARSGYAGTRSPKRIRLLEDPLVARWVSVILHLVPPHQRYLQGTFGVNLLRTRHKIVSGPHQDDENICVVYVLDKVGSGAQTRLHPVDNPSYVEYAATLQPGDIFLFQDSRFLHDVTPLSSEDGNTCRRDVIICTVDYPSTYGVAH